MLAPDFSDNKFEKKFLLDKNRMQKFISRISEILISDCNNRDVNDGYYNHSIYYDGRELNYYTEKHEGLNSRLKVRIRAYKSHLNGGPAGCYLEFKHRTGGVVEKERLALSVEQVKSLLETSSLENIPIVASRVAPVFQYLVKRYDIRPVASILYHRLAFNSSIYPGFRITFDSNVRASPLTSLMAPLTSFQVVVDPRLVVMELKYQNDLPLLLMSRLNEFDVSQVTFSKYAAGMEKIKGLSHHWS